jgi:hypothetical protein
MAFVIVNSGSKILTSHALHYLDCLDDYATNKWGLHHYLCQFPVHCWHKTKVNQEERKEKERQEKERKEEESGQTKVNQEERKEKERQEKERQEKERKEEEGKEE